MEVGVLSLPVLKGGAKESSQGLGWKEESCPYLSSKGELRAAKDWAGRRSLALICPQRGS